MKRKRRAGGGWVGPKSEKVWRRESKRIRTKEEQIIPPLLLLLIIRIKLTKGKLGKWYNNNRKAEKENNQEILRRVWGWKKKK